MNLVFATNNKNKIKEIEALLGDKIKLWGLADINCLEELPETMNTIEGNASQKAQYVYTNYKANCFADDTGLEIEALGGKPGVLSARYAGMAKNSDDNRNKVLQEMRGLENRKARFKTVISLIMDGKEMQFEGTVNGIILENKRGQQGFGYDPIFAPILSPSPLGEGLGERSFAEMDLAQKNKISHRALAIAKLVDYLIP